MTHKDRAVFRYTEIMNKLKKIALSTATLASVASGTAMLAPSASAASVVNVPLSAYHASGTCHGTANGHTYDARALAAYGDYSYVDLTSARVTNIHMQAVLCTSGYKLTIDGVNGSGTQSALRDWQRKHNLAADGMFGLNTAKRMFGYVGNYYNPMHTLSINPSI